MKMVGGVYSGIGTKIIIHLEVTFRYLSLRRGQKIIDRSTSDVSEVLSSV